MSGAVLVIGGGLSGLCAAFRLNRAGARVILCESTERFGGQIHTHKHLDQVVELGAEGFVARSELLPALAADLGLADRLVEQSSTLTMSFEDGVLRDMAPGEAARALGFQVPKDDLGKGIRSFRGGMGELTEALVADMGSRVDLRSTCAVRSLVHSGDRWVAETSKGEVSACAVVVATPAAVAARLLAPTLAQAASLVGHRFLSNASVNLWCPTTNIGIELRGSGILVRDPEKSSGVRAVSFASRKFARGASSDHALLRAFFRPTAEQEDVSGADFVARACAGLLDIVKLKAPPERVWTSVWPQALAVYDDTFKAAVASADAAFALLGGYFAGSHFHGAGIDRAVNSADRAAALALDWVRNRSGTGR